MLAPGGEIHLTLVHRYPYTVWLGELAKAGSPALRETGLSYAGATRFDFGEYAGYHHQATTAVGGITGNASGGGEGGALDVATRCLTHAWAYAEAAGKGGAGKPAGGGGTAAAAAAGGAPKENRRDRRKRLQEEAARAEREGGGSAEEGGAKRQKVSPSCSGADEPAIEASGRGVGPMGEDKKEKKKKEKKKKERKKKLKERTAKAVNTADAEIRAADEASGGKPMKAKRKKGAEVRGVIAPEW